MPQETANAKINWTLAITGRREDGYHTLDTLMQTISLSDTLYAASADTICLQTAESSVEIPEPNLIRVAANYLASHAGVCAGAHIQLRKRIPLQAGLGGGSADVAATLKLLRTLWQLDLTDDALAAIAVRLGADIPFCLRGGLCRARGIGEELLDLPRGERIPLVIMKPDRGVPTPAAFRLWDEGVHIDGRIDPDAAVAALLARDWPTLNECGGNDLQQAAIRLVPEILDCLDALRRERTLYTAMSGSGSAVFGVFADEQEARRAAANIGIHAIFAYAI